MLRFTFITLSVAALAVPFAPPEVTAQPQPAVAADVVLKNATIYDGTGQPPKVGDIAIKADRIVAIGKFKIEGKARMIDCAGLVVSPGFIDLHTHSDFPLQEEKTNANYNYQTQGVTTVVTGNCGFGPSNVADYFAQLEKIGVGTNVIHQVPHNAVREKVMGNANRPPTAKELKAMEELVDQGMKDGAYGFATGLIYNPGTYAKTDELIALAKIAAQHKGLYASHIRNESTEVLVAMEEILEIARRAGIRIHISHIKVSGRSAWGKAGDVISLLRRARTDGIDVTADQYPYTASSTSLTATVIPAKYREGSTKDMVARFDDKEIGPKMKKAIARSLTEHLEGKTIRIARYSKNTSWQGANIHALAEKEKKTPLDIVIEITRNGGAQVVNFGMDEQEMRLFMKEPYVATASDGSSMLPGNTVPHPRSYGTFSRKIGRFAIDDKIISVEQAIRSASGLPADILRLPERGYLKTGYYADIVVFDPKTFRDKATFDQPHQHSTGVRYLFINGRLAIDDAKATDALPGRVLRHQKIGDKPNPAKKKFEIRRAELMATDGFQEMAHPNGKDKIFVSNNAEIVSSDLAGAKLEDFDSRPLIELRFTKEGRTKIEKLSRDHLNKHLAITFDGKVISMPIVSSEFANIGGVLVAGRFSKDEAEKIVKSLNEGLNR